MHKFLIAALTVLLTSAAIGKQSGKILSSLPEVKYTYLDENNNDLGNKQHHDKTGKHLTDKTSRTVIVSKYGQNTKKTISVLFDFSVPVSPNAVGMAWMWGHNTKQWFDTATISIGNDKAKLKQVAVFNNVRKRQNVVGIKIKLPECTGRFIRIDLEQKADVKYFMMGFGEISIYGTKAEYDKLKSSLSDETSVRIEASRHYPANIFDTGEAVRFPVVTSAPKGANVKMEATLYNYFGDIVEKKKFRGPLEFKELSPGYYKLRLTAEYTDKKSQNIRGEKTLSFAVFKKFNRSAAEARNAGCRMGIQLGFNSEEGGKAFAELGLQWVRTLLQFGPLTGRTPNDPFFRAKRECKRWFKNLPFNGLLEIKTFSQSCYDEKRYGPIEKNKKWFIRTVPKEKEYTKYIQDQIACVPKDQNVFEIWNEPWDGMTPKEFADTAQLTLKAIKAVRPNTIVGPNLGPMAHLVKVIENGGMDNMDMLSIHPYSPDFTSSPESAGLRKQIRSYHATLKKHLGRDLPLYVTEIGWPTPPKGPMANSEERQAQYMTRACLIMLAEDIKVVTPYCMGQSEKDPAEKEHFFGFIRKNKEPKPVLIAYANLNRILEGAKYLGDLWMGVDVGAMLFENKGKNILVMYADGKEKKVFLRPFAQKVEMIDIVGNSKKLDIIENRLSLTLDDNPVYLVGVGDELKKQITSKTVKRWSNIYKRLSRDAAPVSNNKPDWSKIKPITVKHKTVPAKDASAIVKTGWDKKNLYIQIKVTDDDPGYSKWHGPEVWKGDAVELYISSTPETAVPGFLRENDYQILVTPYSKSGKPVVVFGDVYRRGKKTVMVKQSFKKLSNGWEAELTVPFSNFKGFKPVKGAKLGFEVALDDRDKKHPRVQITSNNRNDNWCNSSVWSILDLK